MPPAVGLGKRLVNSLVDRRLEFGDEVVRVKRYRREVEDTGAQSAALVAGDETFRVVGSGSGRGHSAWVPRCPGGCGE